VPEGQRVSEADLATAARAAGAVADFIPALDTIVARVRDEARSGDHVLVLSNGAFGGLPERLLRALASNAGPPGRL